MAAPVCAQVHRDIIRGTVRDSTGVLPSAAVLLTRAPDRRVYHTESDVAGRFMIVVDSGTGDYLLYATLQAKPTVIPFRKRLIAQSARDTVFSVDVIIAYRAAVQQLPTVAIQARRPSPERFDEERFGAGVGASEQLATGLAAGVSPDQRGDMDALMSTLPGVMTTAGGPSVLGLPSDQNTKTLNGLAFAGARLPAELRSSATVSTSTYDPSRGWFGGAETRITVESGGPFSRRTASLSADPIALQSGASLARKTGARYSGANGGIGGTGLFAGDRLSYNYGLQLSARQSDLATLSDLDAEVLRAASVSPDSASRFLEIARALSIPARAAASNRVVSSMSFATRINTPELDFATFKPTRTSTGVILYGFHEQSSGTSLGPLVTSSAGATESRSVFSGQGLWSGYATPGVLQEIRIGLNATRTDRAPDYGVPSATALVLSPMEGSYSSSTLHSGGLGSAQHSTGTTIEASSLTKFYLPNTSQPHRVRLDADLRFDAVRSSVPGATFGAYLYPGLDAFAANQPSSFNHTLVVSEPTWGVTNGFVALGDYWRVNQRIQLVYGARVEGNRFIESPGLNASLLRDLNLRTDYAPDRMHISPRLGFTWAYSKSSERAALRTISAGDVAIPALGVIRGGVGEFRSLLGPALLSGGVNRDGEFSWISLTCVGQAVPRPNWPGMFSGAAVPTACAPQARSFEVDSAVGAVIIGPQFDAPRSWRANLAWSSAVRRLTWAVDAIVSYNLNQTSRVDGNFSNVRQFMLPIENRPMFVAPDHIVAATGSLTSADSRLSKSYSSIGVLESNGRSLSRQLVISLTPSLPGGAGRFFLTSAYTLGATRSRLRGFDGPTFASPLVAEWGRADNDVRHSVIVQSGITWTYANLGVWGRIASGRPFTPLVGSDINGDGAVNDRAMIVNPLSTPDTALASQMRALYASAPGTARRCIDRFAGRVAERNGCEGPWTSELNLRLSANTWRFGPAWRRVSDLSLAVVNPLGWVDERLHGSSVRGWGSTPFSDPVLLGVRGFDPQRRAFLYTVNSRFGATASNNPLMRIPARISLSLRFDWGTPTAVQQIDRFLRPGRAGRPDHRLTTDELYSRYARTVPDPFRDIVQLADSLLLSRSQFDALTAAQTRYKARADSAWRTLAAEFAVLPDDFDARAALERQEDVTDGVWEIAWSEVHRALPAVLNAQQLDLLPFPSSMLYRAEKPIKGYRW